MPNSQTEIEAIIICPNPDCDVETVFTVFRDQIKEGHYKHRAEPDIPNRRTCEKCGFNLCRKS